MSGKIRLLIAVLLLAYTVAGCGNGSSGTPAVAFTISGTVSDSSAGIQGVTVTLYSAGSGSVTATTDASGNYTFQNVPNGSYTLTPARTGYTFSPSTVTTVVNNADVPGQNFSATASAPLACTAAHGSGTNGIQFYDYAGVVAQSDSNSANSSETSTLTWQVQYQNIYNLPAESYSGSLRARLWAVPYSVSSGVFDNAYVVGEFYPSFTGTGAASSDQLYVDATSAVQVTSSTGTNPPAGEYCVVVTLEEYNSNSSVCSSADHYCMNDWLQYGSSWSFY